MNHQEPRRLRDADNAVGKLLREFSVTPPDAAEARVWNRLTQHRTPALRRWGGLALGVSAATALVILVWPQFLPRNTLEVVVAELHGEGAVLAHHTQASVGLGTHVALGQTLRTGAGDATLRLTGVGRAVLAQHTEVGVAQGNTLTLTQGRLYLQVDHQSAETPLTITAQTARVVALGTLFWVHVEPSHMLEVQVFQGVVEVRDAHGNHRVGPGERYPDDSAPPTDAERDFMVSLQQGRAGSPPPPTAVPTLPPTPTEPSTPPGTPQKKLSKPHPEHDKRASVDDDDARYDDALLLAKRDPAAAIRALDKLAAQPGERRALARYQAARLCEAVSLKEATERFTAIVNAGNSPFDVEARLSLIEVLLKQQAWQPARHQVTQFVARYPVNERMAELRFLRAEIRRQYDNDCAGALEDYNAAQSLPSRAEDARYFRAWCLMKVGQTEAAAAALKQYLEHYPQGRHTAQARERLESETTPDR